MLRKAFWTTAAVLYGLALLGLVLTAMGAGAGYALLFAGGFLAGTLFALLGNFLEQEPQDVVEHRSHAHPA